MYSSFLLLQIATCECRLQNKTKPAPTVIFKNCSYVCAYIIVYNCCTQHSIEQSFRCFAIWQTAHWSYPLYCRYLQQQVKPVLQKLKTDSDFDVQYYAVESLEGNCYTHNHFTALFPGLPGWADARRKLLVDFMVQGKTTEADTPTIQVGATPSGLISDPPPSSPHFTPDTLPAAFLPLYLCLKQARIMLACIPSGMV